MRAIGLDVHRDWCDVAIYEDGKVRSAGRAHLPWRAEAARQALHEWRDEATRKQREYRDTMPSEGRVAGWERRRRGHDSPRLVLPEPAREALARWRAPATIPRSLGTHRCRSTIPRAPSSRTLSRSQRRYERHRTEHRTPWTTRFHAR